MTRTQLLLVAAAAALAGCKPQTIDPNKVNYNGDASTNTAAKTPVALPPSIQASKAYRCKDNKLIYIDWMSDGSARVKKTREEVGTTVTPGTELKGDASAATISYNGESCKA